MSKIEDPSKSKQSVTMGDNHSGASSSRGIDVPDSFLYTTLN